MDVIFPMSSGSTIETTFNENKRTFQVGMKGGTGSNGLSAYEIAVKNGYKGTEQEWLSSLKGEKGEQGPQGIQGAKGDKGDPGANGKDGYTPIKGTDYFTEADKAEMVSAVLSALPVYNGEVVAE